MESMDSSPSTRPVKCCDCGCECSVINWSLLGTDTDMRSVKRKYEEFEGESQFSIHGYHISQNARVEIENECAALRETVSSQQQTIEDLICELDVERNASSTAANEAMSMILKLQNEKAEVDMEARQFKRFTEEKLAHDQQEMSELEEELYNKDQAIESLTCEVQAYKQKLMNYGLTETEVDELSVAYEEKGMSPNTSMSENLDGLPGNFEGQPQNLEGLPGNLEGQSELPGFDIYPPLKCKTNEYQPCPNGDGAAAYIEKYAFGETPYSGDQLKDLDYRINELEKTPKTIQPDGEYIGANNVFEKVIVGQSPRWSGPQRESFTYCSNSIVAAGKEMVPDYATASPKFGSSIRKTEYSHLDVSSNLRKVENAYEFEDDMSDRVYTIDSIHQGTSVNGVMGHGTNVGTSGDDYLTTPRDLLNHSSVRDLEIQKLYSRLQTLETDRETMRQSIISIGTDKAQLVLLKEIAQNLCKQMSPPGSIQSQKKSATNSSSMSLVKSVGSLVSWRRRAHRSRYTFGLPAEDPGLVMLLERGPRMGMRRYISSTNLWN